VFAIETQLLTFGVAFWVQLRLENGGPDLSWVQFGEQSLVGGFRALSRQLAIAPIRFLGRLRTAKAVARVSDERNQELPPRQASVMIFERDREVSQGIARWLANVRGRAGL